MNINKTKNVIFYVIFIIIGVGILMNLFITCRRIYVDMINDADASVIDTSQYYYEKYVTRLTTNTKQVVVSNDAVAGFENVRSERITQDSDGTYVYLIERGDTLTKISAMFGYSVDAIANFNEIRNVNLIYANSALRIPSN